MRKLAKRKVTEYDVKTAYEIAAKAKESALFSLKRAKQLKIGADKMKSELKENNKKTRYKNGKQK